MANARWIEVGDRVLVRRYEELDQSLGLVVGDELCLVVDTGGNEPHGAEFASAIREVTSARWTVLITHAHWDHYFGTAAFLPCPVWAHRRCHADMVATAESQRAEWARWYRNAGKAALAAQLTAARLALPQRLLTEQTDVDLGGRTVTISHPGRGHTDNDVIVHVLDAAVVFAGDVVEQGAPPAIGMDSYPLDWPAADDALLGLRPHVVVPGHGDPVDAGFVRTQRDELAAVADLCRAVLAGRCTEDEALRRSPYPADTTRVALDRVRSTRCRG